MAKDKGKMRAERWQAKRERMAKSPPSGGQRAHRLKRGRRYNYSDQLKMIIPEDALMTRTRLTAERAELITTLSLMGAEFSVVERVQVLAEVHVETSDVAPSVYDLYESPLYFSLQHNYVERRHVNGKFTEFTGERGAVGIIFPALSYPGDRYVDRMVEGKYIKRDAHAWTSTHSLPRGNTYSGFQFYVTQWVLEGIGW